MPSGPRQTTRPGRGPGRGRARTREGARTPNASRRIAPEAEAPEEESDAVVVTEAPVEEAPAAPARPPRRRRSITTRALALAVVLLILTISYANSLRIYVAQAREIAATQQEITDRQAKITSLEADAARWDDPTYVKQQARARLGWVVPGETGYMVVDADGKPLGGGSEIGKAKTLPVTTQAAWWQRMWGSLQQADQPPADPRTPAAEKPVTEDSKPGQTKQPR